MSEEERELLRKGNGHILITHLRGAFSYASARELNRRVSQQLTGRKVDIYDLSEAGYVDPSAVMALDDLFEQAQSNDQVVMISGLNGQTRNTIKGFGLLKKIGRDHIFPTQLEAIRAAVGIVTDGEVRAAGEAPD